MSSDWRCRGCQAVLGHVQQGRLQIISNLTGVTVSPWGLVTVRCRCGQTREWVPRMLAAR